MGWKQWQRFCNWQKALVKEMQERWMENLGSRVELGTWLGITGCVAEAGEWFSSVDDGNRDPPRAPGLKGAVAIADHSPHGLQCSEATFLCLSFF